jgi:hypothetical protein
MVLSRMRRVPIVALFIAVAVASTPLSASPAAAYNGATAASYAEATWNHCGDETVYVMGKAVSPPDPNSLQWLCGAGGGGDCTNWASQVTNAGGYSMDNFNSSRQWYYKRGYPQPTPWQWQPAYDTWTSSWVNSAKWYNFLVNLDHDNGSSGPGGGWLVAQGYINHNQHSNSLGQGGMIFFDQATEGLPYVPGNIQYIDHTKVEVTWATIGGVTYDYADQHGPQIHLGPWNGLDAVQGYIYQVNIDSRNT